MGTTPFLQRPETQLATAKACGTQPGKPDAELSANAELRQPGRVQMTSRNYLIQGSRASWLTASTRTPDSRPHLTTMALELGTDAIGRQRDYGMSWCS